MELNEQKSMSESEQVILMLPGINRKWIRDKNGSWVDIESLEKPQPAQSVEAPAMPLSEDYENRKRRWWPFGRK